MEVLRCVQCKGEIALEENGLIGRCLSCGSVYYFKTEKNSRIVSFLNQANISRLRGDFDGAILAYQIALKEDETDADAYWGIALSTFGIEYIEDPRTKQFIPTCRRTSQHSILNDINYQNAIKYASSDQAKDFERQAKEIDTLQNNIKEKIKNEQDFDVFLCFKSTDDEGNATEDRFIARNIYNELTKRNIKTFFSEISLKDRLGQDYEPIIYKALYTCKVFILIATKEEHIQASWVKNEWARFRDRMNDEGIENSAFAVFKNIKNNQLPPVYRSQGVDLRKYPAGGYEIEIADNLEVRFKQKKYSTFDEKYNAIFREESAFILEDKVVDLLEKKLANTRLTFDEKLDRALAYDEIGNHEKAMVIMDEIVDEYPRKAKAWYYKAKLLTYNFQTDVVNFHLDAGLKKDYYFNLENAIRFANKEELDLFESESKEFEEKLKTLTLIDQKAEQLEQNIAEYVDAENKINHHQAEETEQQKKNKVGLVQILEDNESKMKELRKHLNKKNYYIKSIPTMPNMILSFFNFIGFMVILSALIGSLVNLRRVATFGNGTYFNIIFEFVILTVIGVIPFIIVSILRKQTKLKKVKHVIEKDQNKLELLKNETTKIKAQIADFEQEEQTRKQEFEDGIIRFKQQLDESALNIKDAYFTVKDLLESEFAQNYVKRYEEFSFKTLEENILQNNAEIALLKEEKQNIIKLNEKNLRELAQKKPKYFSENFETYREKIMQLHEKNKERIDYIDSRLKDLEVQNQVFHLQKTKTFTTDTFFENFLETPNQIVLEQEQPKPKVEVASEIGESLKKEKDDLTETSSQDELTNPEEKDFDGKNEKKPNETAPKQVNNQHKNHNKKKKR